MRSKDCGMNYRHYLPGDYPREESLHIFENMCLTRNFEICVGRYFDAGLIKAPVYLSVGHESISATLPIGFPNPWIFAQHRAHGIYLCYGGPIEELIDELLGLPSGCAQGMGGSASIHCPKIKMIGHDGLMGSQIPIGAGKAMSTKARTLVVMGDASAEEDYALTTFGFVATHRPPVLFVCMDNGLSVLTATEIRRSWDLVKHANFGMPATEITDDPWLIIKSLRELSGNLPALLNIHTCRISPHACTRTDSLKEPEWDRFSLVKEDLKKIGLGHKIEDIEQKTKGYVEKKWQERIEEMKRAKEFRHES